MFEDLSEKERDDKLGELIYKTIIEIRQKKGKDHTDSNENKED